MDHGSDWRGDEQPPEELNLLQDDGRGQFGLVAGLAVAPDDSLLVTDDSNDVIYRVSCTGGASATPASSEVPGSRTFGSWEESRG